MNVPDQFSLTAPSAVFVLLREDLELSHQALDNIFSDSGALPIAHVAQVAGDGKSARIDIAGRQYSVLVVSAPIPRETFHKAFSQPSSQSYHQLVGEQQAHLIVSALSRSEEMREAVDLAATTHVLAAQVAGLGEPLAGFWGESEQLCEWDRFQGYAAALSPTSDGKSTAEYPTRFWVSVQLTQQGESVGGTTQGLKAFSGYELMLSPIEWPMPEVAARLVGTVAYIFQAGDVLKDGESLGVSPTEKFLIQRNANEEQVRLTLDAGLTSEDFQ